MEVVRPLRRSHEKGCKGTEEILRIVVLEKKDLEGETIEARGKGPCVSERLRFPSSEYGCLRRDTIVCAVNADPEGSAIFIVGG
jgi:hypothetical protein